MELFPALTRYQDDLGYRLDPKAIEHFRQYRDLLLEWNQRFNLTRVTDPDEIETRLFLDALAMYQFVQSSLRDPDAEGRIRLVDIGAGAGFPGLPIKIVAPEIELVLIDATAKKVQFLNEVIRALGLSDTWAVHGRAEDLAHERKFRGSFDVVTARAVARLPALIEICMPFSRVGGRGVFPKGSGIEEEIASATRAQRLLHCLILSSEPIAIPELRGTRYVVVRQVDTPPERYPRRPGIPAKDPL